MDNKGGIIFMTTKIIDVSKYQGLIDYDKVKNEIDGVILRASIGTSTDDKFFEYADGFEKAGIPIIGVYHLSHAMNENDARKEAVLAISNVEKAGLGKDSIIFFDFEYESLDVLKNKIKPTRNYVSTLAIKFCSMVRSAGYKSGIYFNPDFYNNWFTKDAISGNVKWLADWRGSRGLDCDIWQYGTGVINGIQNKVDLNECYILDVDIPEESSEPEVPKKSNEELADEVIKGLWENGVKRKELLTAAGYDYDAIQAIVDEKMEALKPKKSNEEMADAVIRGEYGVGEDRKNRLTAEGYDYNAIQAIVDRKMSGQKIAISPAKSRDTSLSGTYRVTASALNLRYIPGLISNNNVIRILYNGNTVQNYGYYTDVNGSRWLYIAFGNETGHVDSRYLTKI